MIHSLLTSAAKAGFLFKVVCEEGSTLYEGGGIFAAKDAIFSVDEATLFLVNGMGKAVDWAYLVNGNEANEIVADCKADGFFDQMLEEFN